MNYAHIPPWLTGLAWVAVAAYVASWVLAVWGLIRWRWWMLLVAAFLPWWGWVVWTMGGVQVELPGANVVWAILLRLLYIGAALALPILELALAFVVQARRLQE